ncbi:translin [Culicoides brevitarsis]|uniref:translin n=1 Tax=Culicoides brevitarsis TaxID=469753 RepID=UPI00307CACD1
MAHWRAEEVFDAFNVYMNKEQEVREQIRECVKELDTLSKQTVTKLQIIHADVKQIPDACKQAHEHFSRFKEIYAKLAALVPQGQYYRYNDHWHFVTQRIVFLIALVQFLEKEELVTREVVGEILGIKVYNEDGFHLDVEDYLFGLLNLATELSRFAVNAVIAEDFERPLKISKFVGELNSGFRLLNLKNDGLRKRFDVLKYDVKKIEEVVYDISIRGLKNEAAKTNN